MAKANNQAEKAVKPGVKYFFKPSRTQQHHGPAADINNIMAKAQRGQMTLGSGKQPMYGDFSSVPGDFQAAVELVRSTEASFSELPALTRERFNNNPAELLTFLADVNNRAEAVRLGLIEDKKPVPPAEKPAVGENKPPAA